MAGSPNLSGLAGYPVEDQIFSFSRHCLPSLTSNYIIICYSGGSAPCTPRFFIPLDGSHEPPVVMTKEKFRESHRVALLMPKVVFRTPSRYKLWLALLAGHVTSHSTLHFRLSLYKTFKCYTIKFFFTMIFIVFDENNKSVLTGKFSRTHWCDPFFTK